MPPERSEPPQIFHGSRRRKPRGRIAGKNYFSFIYKGMQTIFHVAGRLPEESPDAAASMPGTSRQACRIMQPKPRRRLSWMRGNQPENMEPPR